MKLPLRMLLPVAVVHSVAAFAQSNSNNSGFAELKKARRLSLLLFSGNVSSEADVVRLTSKIQPEVVPQIPDLEFLFASTSY